MNEDNDLYKISSEKPVLSDKNARKEKEELFASENKIQLRNHVNRIVIGALYSLAAGSGLVLIIRILHLLMPDKLRWLEPNSIQVIDTLIKYGISSALGGLFVSYVKTNISLEQKEREENR